MDNKYELKVKKNVGNPLSRKKVPSKDIKGGDPPRPGLSRVKHAFVRYIITFILNATIFMGDRRAGV